MRLDFHFLDYIWKALVLGSVTATIFLGSMFFISFVFQASGPVKAKRCLNAHYLLLFFVFVGGLFFVSFGDPELVEGCFNQFVEKTSSSTLTRGLAGLWILLLTVLLGLDFVRSFLAHRRLRSFRTGADPEVLRVFDALKEKMALGAKRVSIQTLPVRGSPFVYGLFHHRIFISESFLRSATEGSLKGAIAHELIHVRERDAVWSLVELLCRRLLFFHPLIYLMNRVFVVRLEQAADHEAVSRSGIGVQEYVQSLLLAVSQGGGILEAPVSLKASRGFVETRDRILALDRRREKTMWGAFALVIAPLLSTVLSVAEARMSIEKGSRAEAMMCSQVAHEKIIESWLRIEPAAKTCKE